MDILEVPFGFVKEDKVYQQSWGDHPEREIGEVRDGDVEKSVQFFQERYADLERKINDVTTKIDETENKGSFLMKLVHLREHLPAHDGLGDYLALHERIVSYENLVKDIIQQQNRRLLAFGLKETILGQLEGQHERFQLPLAAQAFQRMAVQFKNQIIAVYALIGTFQVAIFFPVG